ncbi:MAG: TPM domain-containing protein [Brachymonas sp.]|nr:TPM domain-containing protein [Brachymonas sp.]
MNTQTPRQAVDASSAAPAPADPAAHQVIEQHLGQPVLDRLQASISASEQRHTGQLLLCIEESLSPEDLQRYASPRERALALFGELRVWDTEDNNGALLYLLLDRHAIELVADRALFRCMEQSAWSAITTQLAAALRAQQYESGLQTALAQISDLLIAHFPAKAHTPRDNTVADAPVLLR